MKRGTAVFLGLAVAIGALFGAADPASAARRRATFFYVADADLGFNGTNTAKDDVDPLDPSNQVQSIDTDPSGDCVATPCRVGAIETKVSRDFRKLKHLDGRLRIRYLFVSRTCGLGAPRIQLHIDEDGDGVRESSDGNAFGYIGDQPFGGDCPETVWVSEDMTNAVPKWDASQLGGNPSMTWDQLETLVGGRRVFTATLADDASYSAGHQGCAYYDDFVVGDRKLDRNRDTAGSGAAGAASNDC